MPEKDKDTAAIIALFAGGFGAHKFYLGDIRTGVLYLVFFWTLIPGLLAFIFAIKALMMDAEEFHETYVDESPTGVAVDAAETAESDG